MSGTACVVIAMPVFTPEPLAAPVIVGYVDGGIGSVLFQAAIGGLLTFGYFLTAKWARLKQAFMAKTATRVEAESE